MVRFVAFGFLGSGKTLVAVKEAYRYMKNHPDNNIWSNVPLNPEVFKNFKPIYSTADLFEIDKSCYVLLDEDWWLADSRSTQSPENKAQGIILLRSRKLDWRVAITEQWYTQVEKRLRFVIDVWIYPQYYKRAKVLQEDLYDIHVNFLGTRFYDASKFFDLYNTERDPLTLNIQEAKAEYLNKRQKKLGSYSNIANRSNLANSKFEQYFHKSLAGNPA